MGVHQGMCRRSVAAAWRSLDSQQSIRGDGTTEAIAEGSGLVNVMADAVIAIMARACLVIAIADAIIEPLAVVIEAAHTLVTHTAVPATHIAWPVPSHTRQWPVTQCLSRH